MTNNTVRPIFFLALVLVGLSGPLWLFVTGLGFYIFMYTGIEVIFLAVVIDAYFGYLDGGLFVYTIGTSFSMFLVQYLKPHLSVYNQ